MLGFLEIWVVNPEFMPVADGQARVGAGHFAPEFVGDLEGDVAGAGERLFQEPRGALFGKGGLEAGGFGVQRLEAAQKGGAFGRRERFGGARGGEVEAKGG